MTAWSRGARRTPQRKLSVHDSRALGIDDERNFSFSECPLAVLLLQVRPVVTRHSIETAQAGMVHALVCLGGLTERIGQM